MRLSKILGLLLLIIVALSCKEDLTILDVKFTASQTSIEVGDVITFEVTGSADYWSIFPYGNTENTGTEIEVDEEKKLETSKLEVQYFDPGTFVAKCVGTIIDPSDLSIQRDSAFITITVVDNAEGAHTKFSYFRFKLKKHNFVGFEDKSLRITADGEISSNNIVVKVPNSTAVNDLTPDFDLKPKSKVYYNGIEQESLKSPQDFSNPINYTIVSNDGTEVINTVTVEVQPQESNANLEAFNFYKLPSGTSSESFATSNGYNVVISDSIDLSSVKAEFTIANFARAYIDDVEQVTKKTESDYSAPVDFKVVAEDGTELISSINVLIKPQFDRFYFGSENTFVSEGYYNETRDTIFISNPTNADISSLIPTFKTLPYDATVKANGSVVTSGNESQDFTNPVTYTITTDITSQVTVVVE